MPIHRSVALALTAAALALAAPTVSAAPTCSGEPVTSKATPGADEIRGTDGDDVINGLGGRDVIYTSKGDDIICGGGEADILILSGNGGVANLSKRSATTVGGTATILDIEHLTGTAGDDKLTGDSGKNNLFGGLGNDTLNGLGGDDLVDGQQGNDTLAPGSGHDLVSGGSESDVETLSYKSSSGAISTGAGRMIEHRGDTTRTGIETEDSFSGTFSVFEGSRFDDELTASAFISTTLRGLGGDDQLTGRDANDFLFGGKGDDTLVGGPGNDTLSGGPNSEVKNINARGDLVDYRKTGTLDGVVVDLGANTAQGDGHDVLSGIESATATKKGPSVLYGNDGPNVLIGDHWYDELYGEGGNDILSGMRETDILDGGAGADHLEGGDDSDSLIPGEGDDVIVGGNGCKVTCPAEDDLNYRSAPNAVTVDLSAGSASTGAWGTDTFVEIEAVLGSEFGDVLTGDSGDNQLFGHGGSDSADGGSGFDRCEAEVRVGCEDPAARQRV